MCAGALLASLLAAPPRCRVRFGAPFDGPRHAGTGAGDWDLAVFDSASGRRVAGSAGFRMTEAAQGIATRAGKLTIQACKLSGPTGSAR